MDRQGHNCISIAVHNLERHPERAITRGHFHNMRAQIIHLLGVGAHAFAAQHKCGPHMMRIAVRGGLRRKDTLDAGIDIRRGHKGRGQGYQQRTTGSGTNNSVGPAQITGPRVADSGQHHNGCSVVGFAQCPSHGNRTAERVPHNHRVIDANNLNGFLQ